MPSDGRDHFSVMVSPQVSSPPKIYPHRYLLSGNLENARLAVLQDLGTIPHVTFQDFLEFLAPPQPKFDLDLTMESLKRGKTYTV